MQTIRWGILGPGRIARKFAAGLGEAAGAELAAVGSRDRARAAAFAAESGAARVHGSYADLAADPAVDAVYVGTPHAFHHDHTLLCLEAGKHVLCEKPLALNAAQAGRMIEAARARGLVLMEALWTRFLPAVVRARALAAEGAVGDVRTVTADFGFRAPFDPGSRLFAPALGGGALLDLGIYPLNLAFMICGEPEAMASVATLGETGVDEEEAIVLGHAGGRQSLLAASLRVDTPREARILGTDGSLTLPFPWWAASRLVLRRRGGAEEILDLPGRGAGYAHEAEAFMDAIRAGDAEVAGMPLGESLRILRTMDALRARWGVRYPGEDPDRTG